jgi:hypothetical protein
MPWFAWIIIVLIVCLAACDIVNNITKNWSRRGRE